MSPPRIARSQMNVPPRFRRRSTGIPRDSSVCASSSPRRICSVKFLDPIRIVAGLPRHAAAIHIVAATAAMTATTGINRRPRRPPEMRACTARSARSSAPSSVSASAADGIAPARMTVGSTIDRPRKMYSPRPPAPTAAAIVAVPTPMTAATRMPATIDGSASGSCTCRSNCRGVIPSAVPASTRAPINRSNPGDRRADDWQQCVNDEHRDRDARAKAADERQRQQEAEHGQARDRLRHVDEPDEGRAQARPARREDRKRNADRDGRGRRHGHQSEVLE